MSILPNLGLHGDLVDHQIWGTEGRANDRRLDALVQASVKCVLNDPPASPLDGDRYVVGTSPTGSWAGKAGSIAAWDARLSTWTFYSPKQGWSTWVEDEKVPYRYGGATWDNNLPWVEAPAPSGGDDTAAIVAAINAAPAGATLHFRAGVYNLTTWTVQTLSKAIWIKGNSERATVLRGTSSASFLLVNNYLRVSDIAFLTWSTIFDFSQVSALWTDIIIERCLFVIFNRAVYGLGTVAGTGVSNFYVQGCQFLSGTSYPIFLNLPVMERIYVTHNTIKTCVQRAIDLPGGPSQ